MKKLLLLVWMIALTISIYGQGLDTITDAPSQQKGELEKVAKTIELNYKPPKEYITTYLFDLKNLFSWIKHSLNMEPIFSYMCKGLSG
ncbi:hypothetical protein [Parabacteroides sp. AM08-6]|uniref:hypothetical protein n=1 Tax=Parabacteroides sp. AM08-6 TaxID=2292053 RepID=UPI000EFF1FF8|nr:hypothetical protein [Parabacteroides sp. AM08-6]RHJ76817.1 hypothetical protein DW103_16640 [Parabacteroides sp. AM08-6]